MRRPGDTGRLSLTREDEPNERDLCFVRSCTERLSRLELAANGGGGHPLQRGMKTGVRLYIAGIAVSAGLAIALLAIHGRSSTFKGAGIAAFLCTIGWVARRLTYEGAPQGTHGRAYFLVFPAAALAVADWTVPVAVALTMFAIERARGAETAKLIFNTATPALASGVGIAAYQIAGGIAWVESSTIMPIAIFVLLTTIRIVNDLALVGVLALSQARAPAQTLRAVLGTTLVDDLLVAPIVGFLAHAIVVWGVVATLAIAASLVWVQRLYQTNRAVTRLSEELLELMVTAIEARDPYTSGHSRRVSHMAAEIARVLGLTDAEIKRVSIAGLLHDVGKIHEKYATVLQKPDRLTHDEWLLMREHPVDGEALVGKVSQLHDIQPAIRHHHERWDGSGYPDGLAGEAIPLMARILSFADTIDAMTSTRPYRRGLACGEVQQEIISCAGRQFDPTIAEKLAASDVWGRLIQSGCIALGELPPRSISTASAEARSHALLTNV